jgi:CBS domain-containing protein
MNIENIVSTEFHQVDATTPASKLAGLFDDPTVKAAVVTEDGEYRGLVTRRQLASSHRSPEQKVASLVWHVPQVESTTNVREVARLMVGSQSMVLPVMDGESLAGVVTAAALIEMVRPYLDVATVEDVYSSDLLTIPPDETLGAVLNTLRENRITHLPVVEDDSLVGIVSLHDVIDFTTRRVERSRGGKSGREASGEAHGGFGAREGELDRMLDLPVRDVMSDVVDTARPDESLDDVVHRMLDKDVSSLVVVDPESEDPLGIVTKTDVLRSLTWSARGRRAVTIAGMDLMEDISYEQVVDMVEELAAKYSKMSLLEAKVHLHEHDETFRGTSLILARIRLYTDRGHFIASGEGYGARHAIHLARNALERQILEGKTYGRSKKPPADDVREKLYGWWLSG